MQFTSMSPKERHSSGTVITINHNLLLIFMSLSTPCFNFFINDDKVFCTPGLASFLHLPEVFSLLFLFPPYTLPFCRPLYPSYLPSPTSELLPCWCTKLLSWPVTNKLTFLVHAELSPASSEGLLLLPFKKRPSERAICDHSCPVWMSHLKPWSCNSSSDECS